MNQEIEQNTTENKKSRIFLKVLVELIVGFIAFLGMIVSALSGNIWFFLIVIVMAFIIEKSLIKKIDPSVNDKEPESFFLSLTTFHWKFMRKLLVLIAGVVLVIVVYQLLIGNI